MKGLVGYVHPAGLITFMDGATEGSIVSEVLQSAGVDENISDAAGSIADLTLGGKSMIGNVADLGSAFLKKDGLSSMAGTTVKMTAETALTGFEAKENEQNIKNIVKKDDER